MGLKIHNHFIPFKNNTVIQGQQLGEPLNYTNINIKKYLFKGLNPYNVKTNIIYRTLGTEKLYNTLIKTLLTLEFLKL